MTQAHSAISGDANRRAQQTRLKWWPDARHCERPQLELPQRHRRGFARIAAHFVGLDLNAVARPVSRRDWDSYKGRYTDVLRCRPSNLHHPRARDSDNQARYTRY